MLARQGYLGKSVSHVSFLLVAAIGFLAIGYVLGQPRVKPFLLEVLLLSLGVCLAFLAATGFYIFMKPVKRSETRQTFISACAVALLLIMLFFIGKWISVA